MANRTITQLLEKNSPGLNDYLIIQETTSNTTKKITTQNLFNPFVFNTSTVVQGNSANWNSVYTTFRDVSSTFLTSETDSQTLTFNEGTKDLSISNGNTISLSALTDLTAIDTEVRSLTSNWESTYTTVQTNSASWKLEDFIIVCGDETSNLTTSVSSFTFRAPFEMVLNSVRASVTTSPSGSDIIVDVLQNDSSIFSTLLTIDENETTSTTSTTLAVVSSTNITDDAKMVVSLNQVGSIDPGTGLKLTFKGYRVQ